MLVDSLLCRRRRCGACRVSRCCRCRSRGGVVPDRCLDDKGYREGEVDGDFSGFEPPFCRRFLVDAFSLHGGFVDALVHQSHGGVAGVQRKAWAARHGKCDGRRATEWSRLMAVDAGSACAARGRSGESRRLSTVSRGSVDGTGGF